MTVTNCATGLSSIHSIPPTPRWISMATVGPISRNIATAQTPPMLLNQNRTMKSHLLWAAIALWMIHGASAQPSITAQPTNQIAEVGDTVTFSALAAGTPPLFYQWLFHDEIIGDRTNANLYLRNIQLTNAGDYKVVVTNMAGSTTSQVATLTVVPPTITTTSGRNILLVIADDYGTDSLSLYNTNASASLPPTPNINSLCNSGVLFRN